jgi:hypothetical protein
MYQWYQELHRNKSVYIFLEKWKILTYNSCLSRLQSIFQLNSPELSNMSLNLSLKKLQGSFRWISSLQKKKKRHGLVISTHVSHSGCPRFKYQPRDLKLGHDHHFLPHSYQFIIHLLSYDLMLYNLRYRQRHWINHK